VPIHQNTTVTGSKLILGNYKIETAAYGTSAGGTWVNCGAGIVNSFAHNLVKYDTQAGNAPDPLEGIADETFVISGELIEFDASVLAAISCGAMTKTTGASGVTIINAGGNQILTDRAFKFTNSRLIGSTTQSTVILTYKATLDNGLQFTSKSDNDADPIQVMPFTITAKPDGTLSAGSQLYSVTETYNA
jgi:hypothetical protein